MNLEYKNLINPDFHPSSRVWVYQSSRLLTLSEALDAEALIQEFVTGWMSHSDAVLAEGHLFFGQFVVLIADERNTTVSGCSTDSSVRFIKKMGDQFNTDFFNRQLLAFIKNGKIEVLPLSQFNFGLENGFITPETLYFNNLVATKSELENQWIIPINQSWLKNRLPLVNQ